MHIINVTCTCGFIPQSDLYNCQSQVPEVNNFLSSIRLWEESLELANIFKIFFMN